ncbi:MAG: 4-hydroxy-tetrahydrodipicolinate reductase [Ignavibacteriaceae bacterium]
MKYGVIGFSGRLGSEVVRHFNDSGHKLTFKLDLNTEEFIEKPDVMIDCSLPEAFDKTVNLIRMNKLPLVIASTGLTEDQINQLKEISVETPVVQSYNFSIGVQILLHLAKVAKIYLPDWDVEISETHHRFKKDKPSGTAKMIRDTLNDNSINVSSLRLGNITGEHSVYFASAGDKIEITHTALSRRTFAEGILLSAGFILGKEKGFFSFRDVVFGT